MTPPGSTQQTAASRGGGGGSWSDIATHAKCGHRSRERMDLSSDVFEPLATRSELNIAKGFGPQRYYLERVER